MTETAPPLPAGQKGVYLFFFEERQLQQLLPPYPIELPYHVEVVVPEGISVSTAEAYGGIGPSFPELRLRDVLALPVGEWKDRLVNDFETTVFRKHPERAAVKKSLYESGAVYASMSGSGSALFALYG